MVITMGVLLLAGLGLNTFIGNLAFPGKIGIMVRLAMTGSYIMTILSLIK